MVQAPFLPLSASLAALETLRQEEEFPEGTSGGWNTKKSQHARSSEVIAGPSPKTGLPSARDGMCVVKLWVEFTREIKKGLVTFVTPNSAQSLAHFPRVVL